MTPTGQAQTKVRSTAKRAAAPEPEATGPAPKPEPSSAPAGPRPSSIGAVRHAISVLRCIAEAGGPVGVNELARRVGLDKSTVSRIVATLGEERLVSRDPASAQVKLGIGLVALAAPVLATLDARQVARPHLEALASRSGETISFSVWDGEQAISVEQALGARAVRAYAAPGRRNPAHCTAAGKMLLAQAGPAALEALLARPLARHTAATIVDGARLRTALARIRRQGHAVNRGELEADVGAVSAPVLDRHGATAGTITATVPMYRFAPQLPALIGLVTETARTVSAELGFVRDA